MVWKTFSRWLSDTKREGKKTREIEAPFTYMFTTSTLELQTCDSGWSCRLGHRRDRPCGHKAQAALVREVPLTWQVFDNSSQCYGKTDLMAQNRKLWDIFSKPRHIPLHWEFNKSYSCTRHSPIILNSALQWLYPPIPPNFIKLCACMTACVLSYVRLFATLRTVARQAPPSMGFSRQEYWSGSLYFPPRDIPDQGSKPGPLYLLHCRQILYHCCCCCWQVLILSN